MNEQEKITVEEIQNYANIVLRVESPHSKNALQVERLLHAYLGCITETDELHRAELEMDEANCNEEIGDCLWYSVLGLTALDHPSGFGPVKRVGDIDVYYENAPQVADILKRWRFYNKPPTQAQLDFMHVWFRYHLYAYPTDMVRLAMDLNIRKLKARYPKGFTDDAAINRNLQLELSVIKESVQ